MVKEYELIHIEISKLKFDASNPNQLTDAELKAMRHSMEKFGYLTPIIVDQNYNIADGEHRVYTYKEAGKTTIPAYVVPCKTDAERRLIRQTLNKLRGHHKRDLDIEEFKFIFEAGLKEDLLALLPDNKELEKFLAKDIKEDEFDVDKSLKEPKYKINSGEVWQLGNHRLVCGDATKKEDVDKLMNGQIIDILFTDPPYGINIVHRSRVGTTSNLGFVGIEEKPKSSLAKARIYREVIGDDKPFDPSHLLQYGKVKLIFGANNFASKLPDSAVWLVWDKKKEGGLDHNSFSDVELIWTNSDKKASLIYRHLWSGLLRVGDRDTELKERVHPTQKPVGLLTQILNDFSQSKNNVLDLYGGSGSTLIACEQLNRKCFMMEIDPAYCSVILERWESLTNKKAVKVA